MMGSARASRRYTPVIESFVIMLLSDLSFIAINLFYITLKTNNKAELVVVVSAFKTNNKTEPVVVVTVSDVVCKTNNEAEQSYSLK